MDSTIGTILVLTVLAFTTPMAFVGCAALGLPTAETFNEKAAATLGTITTVRTTATSLLNQKRITAEDGKNVLVATDAARTGLDVARSLHQSNPTAANQKLDAVRAGLTALQSYLAARERSN